MDLRERLAAVEAGPRLQVAVGTSHLQQLEMAPSAFGLIAAARPAIKAIRKRRNAALHVVPKLTASTDEGAEITEAADEDTTQCATDKASKEATASNDSSPDDRADVTEAAETTPDGTPTENEEDTQRSQATRTISKLSFALALTRPRSGVLMTTAL